MDLDSCIAKGLINKSVFSNEIIIKEFNQAKTHLETGERLFNSGEIDASIIVAYLSLFHFARIILYSEGYKERSHFCVFQYLVEKYCKHEISNLARNCLNYLSVRHKVQYDGLHANKTVPLDLIDDAHRMHQMVKNIMIQKKIING